MCIFFYIQYVIRFMIYFRCVLNDHECTTELSKKLGVSQPSVSISVKRCEKIAKAMQFELIKGQKVIILWASPNSPKPHSSARCAGYRLVVIKISMALGGPSNLASRAVPPRSAIKPNWASGSPQVQSSLISRISQARATSTPKPNTPPCMAQIIGISIPIHPVYPVKQKPFFFSTSVRDLSRIDTIFSICSFVIIKGGPR